MADKVICDVKEKCGIIAKRSDKTTLELRYVAWNEREPRYDIRPWYIDEDTGKERCLRGLTLSGEELIELGNIIDRLKE